MANSIQFFLKERKAEAEILEVLNRVLGFLVETMDIPVDGSVGVAMISQYPEGYQQGCLVSWPDTVEPQRNDEQIAKEIALRLRVPVLTETSDTDEDWLLTLPDGSQRTVDIRNLRRGVDVA